MKIICILIYMMNLPKEILLKIDGIRRDMFRERIDAFERTSKITIAVRHDKTIMMIGMTFSKDANKGSFAGYCLDRAICGKIYDWRPGMLAIVKPPLNTLASYTLLC